MLKEALPKRDKTSCATRYTCISTLEVTAESLHNFMKEKFNDLEEKVRIEGCIDNLLRIVDDQKQTINEMNEKITVLESEITHLKKSSDDTDQYQRRLRINGIELPPDGQMETRKDCLEKVQNVLSELNVEIPEIVIDRAHRIGKVVKINSKNARQMIVHMTTWRHRTMVYEARKNFGMYKIKLDLTKHRIDLLKEKSK